MVLVRNIEFYALCERHLPLRGVEKQNSRTLTSAMRGVFRNDGKTRGELLRLTAR